LSPIRNESCSINNLKKLILHMKSIRKDRFLKKYRRIAEITKVSMHNLTIKALMYFLDPEYWCFTFRNVNICPTLEENGLLTEFPWNIYKIYFHHIHNKVLTEVTKLIKVQISIRYWKKVLVVWSGKWLKKCLKGGRMTLDMLNKRTKYLL